MYSLSPNEISAQKIYNLMASSIGPRPIALASTINKEGQPNLSPFSHFNFFGVNPAIIVFSPMQRINNGQTRDTLDNVEDTKEVVINVVDYDMIQQTSLASMDYNEEVNEFEKAGLTMLESDEIAPKRVAESPVHYECRVDEVLYKGNGPGSANLVICEVLKMHISEMVSLEDKNINQDQLDLIGRMGERWYTRARTGMFEVIKSSNIGIGVDQLPQVIKESTVLTGNDLGKLGNVKQKPEKQTIESYVKKNELAELIEDSSVEKIHAIAQEYLRKRNVDKAWNILLAKHKKEI